MWAADAASDGLVDRWLDDGTHASKYGSYLSALTLFGTLTGIVPWSFGANEQAAKDLGIAPAVALKLQQVASDQLHALACRFSDWPACTQARRRVRQAIRRPACRSVCRWRGRRKIRSIARSGDTPEPQ